MDYKETSELIDKIIERYSKASNELISTEFERVNDKIGKLTEQVTRQNGSVRELKEWRAAHCEETKSLREKLNDIAAARIARVDVAMRYVTIVLAIVSVGAAIYFGNQNLKIRDNGKDVKKEVVQGIDNLSAFHGDN